MALVGAVLSALWWQPAAASADPTVVRILGGGVLQVSSPDDDSDIQVAGDSIITVLDFDHTLVAVSPCTRLGTQNVVQCPGPGLTSVTVLTGAGNDLVQLFTALPALVVTGAGNDDVRDWLSRQSLVLLGDGDDEASSGDAGPTTVFGGNGRDTIAYTVRSTGVSVSLDDVANDGAPGENDNIHSDVENIWGSTARDTLTGNAGRNTLRGMAGNDRLAGRAGDDTLIGGSGHDTAAGGSGTDTCRAETTTSCP